MWGLNVDRKKAKEENCNKRQNSNIHTAYIASRSAGGSTLIVSNESTLGTGCPASILNALIFIIYILNREEHTILIINKSY